MKTQEKIRNLEREIQALWHVIEGEQLWHPSVIQEIRRRSATARRSSATKGLRKAGAVLGSSPR